VAGFERQNEISALLAAAGKRSTSDAAALSERLSPGEDPKAILRPEGLKGILLATNQRLIFHADSGLRNFGVAYRGPPEWRYDMVHEVVHNASQFGGALQLSVGDSALKFAVRDRRRLGEFSATLGTEVSRRRYGQR